ncbi:MAG: helix-turn-helix domain-containing protein [Clostridiales bacterium]|nr:helix-turn-helix domain-containing protein [Clostridiales bacterium]
MNYLAELNAFHDYLLANQLSTSEIVLWHALMHINNKTMWKTEFTASNLILQQLTGLSRSTLADTKNKLKQRGLLSYKPGKPRQAGTFCMVSLLEESELVQQADEFPDELSDESRTSSRTNSGRVPGTLININKDINKNKEKEKINKKKKFTPPAVDEVAAYCLERKNSVDAQKFVDYYTANGWMVGKNKMRDWKAAVRTWERNNFNRVEDGKRPEKIWSRPPNGQDSLDDLF